jgi:integrase
MKLKEALQHFLVADRAPQTQKTYERFFPRFAETIGLERPLHLIRPTDLDAYVHDLRHQAVRYAGHPRRPREQGRLSPATITKRIKMIKALFNWCVTRGYLDQSPARFLSPQPPQQKTGEGKAISAAEVDALLKAAHNKPRDRAIVLLLSQSGCRAGDVANLRISNLVLSRCRAIVDGKGDKRRTIYFDTETAEAIQDWLKCRPTRVKHDYVFTSVRGYGPLKSDSVSQIIRRLSKAAGLDRTWGTHCFRHYVAMTLARARVSPTVIQAYLGHANVSTTMGYCAAVADEDLHAAAELLRGQKRKNPAGKIIDFPQTG